MEHNLLKENWTLITIDDPDFLSGNSLFQLIQLMLFATQFKFVIIYEIYGNTEAIANLEKKENTIMKIEDLLKDIRNVKQFDWGDFFLFRECPEKWEILERMPSYPDLIIQANTTLRAVDDQYMYIYTKDKNIINVIKENYKIESITIDNLENLPHPY